MTMRAHPLIILHYLRRYVALLLLAPVRSAITLAISGALPTYWGGEIAVAATLVAYCTAKWLSAKITISHEQITLHEGLIVQRANFMSNSDVVTVNLTTSPVAALLGGRRVTVYAEHNRHFCDIYLSTAAARRLTDCLGLNECGYVNRFSPAQLLVAAVSESSIISGILLTYTAYSRLQQVAVIDTEPYLSGAVQLVERYLPRTLSLAAVVLLIGYVTALGLSVARLALLRVRVGSRVLRVGSGVFARRVSYIAVKKIVTVTVKAPIIMQLFGRCSYLVGAVGFGKQRGQSAVVLPAVHRNDGSTDNTVTPSPKANRRAYLAPTVWLAIIMTSALIVALTYPTLRLAVGLTAALLTTYMAAHIYARIKAHRRGGIAIGRQIKVESRSGTAATETSMDIERVSAVTEVSGPFDRRLGVCTIRFYPTVGGRVCKIKNIDSNTVQVGRQI